MALFINHSFALEFCFPAWLSTQLCVVSSTKQHRVWSRQTDRRQSTEYRVQGTKHTGVQGTEYTGVQSTEYSSIPTPSCSLLSSLYGSLYSIHHSFSLFLFARLSPTRLSIRICDSRRLGMWDKTPHILSRLCCHFSFSPLSSNLLCSSQVFSHYFSVIRHVHTHLHTPTLTHAHTNISRNRSTYRW